MHILTALVCVLSMTVIMLGYFTCVSLLEQKAGISQVARKYLLRMETTGYLTAEDQLALCAELSVLGVQDVDLSDSTNHRVTYGEPIFLVIKGQIRGESMVSEGGLFATFFRRSLYAFEERKMSTAKN